MHDNTHNALIADAFAAIKSADPKLYARMDAADWTITTDPVPIINTFATREFRKAVRDMIDGRYDMTPYGLTASDHDANTPTDHPMSWISTDGCTDRANYLHVTPAHFTAMILAHEFAHIHDPSGHTEAHAYRAGSKFAAMLPYPDGAIIKSYSDYIARDNV